MLADAVQVATRLDAALDREEARADDLCECVLSGCLEEPHCCSERAWEDVHAVGRAVLWATQEVVLRFFLIYFIRFSRRGLGFQTEMLRTSAATCTWGSRWALPSAPVPCASFSMAVTCPCSAWRHQKQPGCGVLAWSPLPQVGANAALAPQPLDSGPEVGWGWLRSAQDRSRLKLPCVVLFMCIGGSS